jgi:hypothetical protein
VNDDERLAKLSPVARAEFARAIKLRAKPGEAFTHATLAIAAAGVPPISERAPRTPLFPLASNLDGVQRAALEYSAIHDLGVGHYACPSMPNTRRRWLGLDPPGLLESHAVTVEHEGGTTTEPLWRALQLAGEIAKQAPLLDALPIELALRSERSPSSAPWAPATEST